MGEGAVTVVVKEVGLREKAANWWIACPSVDLALSLLAVLLYLALDLTIGPSWTLSDVEPGQRALIYGAAATVAALAAGSNNTAVGGYVSSSNEVMAALRIAHGAQIRSNLRSVAVWLWIAALTSLICLALDPLDKRDPRATWAADYLCLVVVCLIALKFVRLTLLQDLILRANDLHAQQVAAATRKLPAAKWRDN